MTWQDEVRLWDRMAALTGAAAEVARLVYQEGLAGEVAGERADGLMDALWDVDPAAAEVARLMYRCGLEDRLELDTLERAQ